MGNPQIILILSLLLMALPSRADWLATLNRGGYFGRFSVGVIYEYNRSHEIEASAGSYDLGKSSYWQLNGAYRFSFWDLQNEGISWRPLQIGIFTITSRDGDRFFKESPSKYPSAGYYDETNYRWGAEVGSCMTFWRPHLEVAYRIRIIDIGLLAIYNNAHRDLQYYVSSGLALHYRF